MRILLAMEAVYYPGFGGANKVVRAVAEQLTERGHAAFVVTPAIGASGFATLPELHLGLTNENVLVKPVHEADEFALNGVQVHAVHSSHRYLAHLELQIQAHKPEVILVTSEDWDGGLLETALQVGTVPVFVLVTTPIALPFGPFAMRPSAWRKELYSQVEGIFAVSRYTQAYILRWGDMQSTLFYTPAFGRGPYLRLGGFDNPYVTMLNPSMGKGIEFLLALATRLPDVRFGAVPTWATSGEDLAAMSQLPNIEILAAQVDINVIWAQTRVALMPSLWPEGFPLTVVEAMLSGIPVLACDQGGVAEAKLGTDFVLPVAPITGYTTEQRPGVLPEPIAPVQPREFVERWVGALELLVHDREVYERHADTARKTASRFASSLTVEVLEAQLKAAPHERGLHQRDNFSSAASTDVSARLSGLTAGQRALLQQWLQQEQR